MPGQEYEWEFRAVGSKPTFMLNGVVLGEVQDDSLAEGTFGIMNSGRGKPEAKIKALDFLDLDPPGGGGGSAVGQAPRLPGGAATP